LARDAFPNFVGVIRDGAAQAPTLHIPVSPPNKRALPRRRLYFDGLVADFLAALRFHPNREFPQ
jgi:hypothetical protein